MTLKNVEGPNSPTPLILTGGQLLALPVQQQHWIVNGLLRVGRKRASLFCGKAESGKSSLSWQLGVSVCKGADFLGRATQRSEVLYLQSEEDTSDIQTFLKVLKYNPETDAALRVYTGGEQDNTFKTLRTLLTEYPTTGLVIVETLDTLFKLPDLNNNSDARKRFDQFDKLVMDDFHHGTAFLLLHHQTKKETDAVGDQILGGSVIRGRTDAKWYIKQRSDDDPRREFKATVRLGRPIEPTFLDYDEDTRTSVLGPTVAEDKKNHAGDADARINRDIIKWFTQHPNTSFETGCLKNITGNTTAIRNVKKALVRSGLLVESGSGSKTKPFTYRLAEIPSETPGVIEIPRNEQQEIPEGVAA